MAIARQLPTGCLVLLALSVSAQSLQPPVCSGDGDFPAGAASLAVTVAPSPVVLGDSIRVTYTLRNEKTTSLTVCLSNLSGVRFSFQAAGAEESVEEIVVPDHPACDWLVLPPGFALVWTRTSVFDGFEVGPGTLTGVVELDAMCSWRGDVRSEPVAVHVVSG